METQTCQTETDKVQKVTIWKSPEFGWTIEVYTDSTHKSFELPKDACLCDALASVNVCLKEGKTV